MSLRKDRLYNPPIYFLNNPLQEVLSLMLLGLTICHVLGKTTLPSWPPKPVTDWAVGILCQAKSFLGTPELLTTYKAFICSSMEYCSPLWAGAPASHLARLHAVETKAFRIIGISRDEANSKGFSLTHRRQVGGLSVFYRLLSGLAPPSSLWALSPKYSYRSHKICLQPSYG